jgi:cellulose biosynthesis protein BcsQ
VDAVQPTYWHGLDLIAANLTLYRAEFSLTNRQKSVPNFRFYQALKEGIATVSDRYDVIVIDTPPALSYATTNALYAADRSPNRSQTGQESRTRGADGITAPSGHWGLGRLLGPQNR